MDIKNTVVYITDDGYVEYTAMSVRSVLKHSSTSLNIKIICNGVSEANKKKLMVSDCVSLIDYVESGKIKPYKNHRHISNTMYIKFEIPNIVDDDFCLYLDGDTVAVKDISEVFKYDIGGFLIGAVKDFGVLNIWKSDCDKCKDKKTFNTGVMLMNLKKMREIGFPESLHEAKRNDKDGKFVTDQEVFNDVIEKEVLYIPPKFNASMYKIKFNMHEQYRDISLYNELYCTNYGDMEQFLSDVVINHFHGDKGSIYGSEFFKKWIKDIGLENQDDER